MLPPPPRPPLPAATLDPLARPPAEPLAPRLEGCHEDEVVAKGGRLFGWKVEKGNPKINSPFLLAHFEKSAKRHVHFGGHSFGGGFKGKPWESHMLEGLNPIWPGIFKWVLGQLVFYTTSTGADRPDAGTKQPFTLSGPQVPGLVPRNLNGLPLPSALIPCDQKNAFIQTPGIGSPSLRGLVRSAQSPINPILWRLNKPPPSSNPTLQRTKGPPTSLP